MGRAENRYGVLWVEGPDRLLAGGRSGADITGGREDEEIDLAGLWLLRHGPKKGLVE